jgi:putative ABC transport system substrate-binding protein
MDRRRFLLTSLAGALAGPVPIEAQQAAKLRQIGFLPAGAGAGHRQQLEALREGLSQLGYVEGRTIAITAVWPKTTSQLPELAASLVRQKVELIVAPSTPAVTALKRLTQTIPIVFATSADPVGSGFVASLARPGGNITGLSVLNIDLSGKRVDLLHEAFPSRKAVMLLLTPEDDVTPTTAILKATEQRGRAQGVDVRFLRVTREEDLSAALAGLHPARDGGLVVLPTALALSHAPLVAELALKHKLPTIGDYRLFVESGGLMFYGADHDDQLRGAATYVDRILRGTPPKDLPVQQPSRFRLVINLKTAKALGLTIPPSLLLRADQVIDP